MDLTKVTQTLLQIDLTDNTVRRFNMSRAMNFISFIVTIKVGHLP